MKFDTIREACREWVSQFNAIPQSAVVKLAEFSDFCDMTEITPPAIGGQARVVTGDHARELVTIIRRDSDDAELLTVRNEDGEEYEIAEDELGVERDSGFPMWGTMWAFGDNIDNSWLDSEFVGDGLRLMADCGFRIYESEDWQYVFGIDGCGYDFYEEHWIPLYKARGLHWHKDEKEAV